MRRRTGSTASNAGSLSIGIQADLPVLLGDIAPVTYLVVFQPRRVVPGGGAALSTAVVQFDKGRMEVLEKGPVSPDFTNPAFPWNPVSRGPYYAETNARMGRVVQPAPGLPHHRREHDALVGRRRQRTGGRGHFAGPRGAGGRGERHRSDRHAAVFGQITADNLVQKLFFEGYNEDPVARAT